MKKNENFFFFKYINVSNCSHSSIVRIRYTKCAFITLSASPTNILMQSCNFLPDSHLLHCQKYVGSTEIGHWRPEQSNIGKIYSNVLHISALRSNKLLLIVSDLRNNKVTSFGWKGNSLHCLLTTLILYIPCTLQIKYHNRAVIAPGGRERRVYKSNTTIGQQ